MTKHSWLKRDVPKLPGLEAAVGQAWAGGPLPPGGPSPGSPQGAQRHPRHAWLSALGSARTVPLGRSSEPQSLVRRWLQGCTAEPLGERLLLRGPRPGGPNYRVEWGARHGKERGAQS